MEIVLNKNQCIHGLWWQTFDGHRGLSSWEGEGKWAYSIRKGNSFFLRSNPDPEVKVFDNDFEAETFLKTLNSEYYIVAGWLVQKVG